MLISSAESRDRQRNKRTVQFHLVNDEVVQRIMKNGRVTHDISYSKDIWEDVADAILDTQQALMDERNQEGLPFNLEKYEGSTQSGSPSQSGPWIPKIFRKPFKSPKFGSKIHVKIIATAAPLTTAGM